MLVLLLCMWHSFASFAGLFALVSLIGVHEFYKLFKNTSIKPNIGFGLLLSAITYLSFVAYAQNDNFTFVLILAIPIIALLFINELYRARENPFSNIGITILGVLYVVVPFGYLLIANFSEPSEWMSRKFDIGFAFFFMLWANDTGAYIFGSWLGKHKLFERISPKKSWEGFIGGALVAVLVGYLFSLNSNECWCQWMIMSLIIVVFGTLGDLVESMLKRSLNVKDSGAILPGHGGILDRFDGLLLAAPMVYFLLELLPAVSDFLN